MCGENRFNNFIYYVRNYTSRESRESSILGDVERRICDEEMDEAREREKRAIRCCDLLPASVGAFRSQIEKNEG